MPTYRISTVSYEVFASDESAKQAGRSLEGQDGVYSVRIVRMPEQVFEGGAPTRQRRIRHEEAVRRLEILQRSVEDATAARFDDADDRLGRRD